MADVFEKGDIVYEFAVRSPSNKEIKLSDKVGVPVVLLFLGDNQAAADAACRALAAIQPDLAKFGAYILAIRREGSAAPDLLIDPHAQTPPAGPPSNGEQLPFEILRDANAVVTRQYGALGKLRAVLINPNARIARIYDPADPANLGHQVLADVTSMMTLVPPRPMIQQAPVLLVPDVLPPEVCTEMIDVWKNQGNADSGFMVEKDGKTVGVYDYGHKIRRDHFVQNGTPVYVKLREYLSRRVVSQVKKAFNFECTRLEQIKIACYDATRGGYFRPHRDNTTGGTAHRQFAVSLLLNNEYEGGYLRFPEFGPHLYRRGRRRRDLRLQPPPRGDRHHRGPAIYRADIFLR